MTDIKKVIAKLKAEREKIEKKLNNYRSKGIFVPGSMLNRSSLLENLIIPELEKYLEPEDKCGFKVHDCYNLFSDHYIEGLICSRRSLIDKAKGIFEVSKDRRVYEIRYYKESENEYREVIVLDKSGIQTIIEALTNALKVMKD